MRSSKGWCPTNSTFKSWSTSRVQRWTCKPILWLEAKLQALEGWCNSKKFWIRTLHRIPWKTKSTHQVLITIILKLWALRMMQIAARSLPLAEECYFPLSLSSSINLRKHTLYKRKLRETRANLVTEGWKGNMIKGNLKDRSPNKMRMTLAANLSAAIQVT